MSRGNDNKSIWRVIRKLCLAAGVYFIWQERNMRLFSNYKRDEKELFDIMCEELRAKMVSISVKNSNNVLQAEAVWNVKMEVAELRMLRWTCGSTILDMIPNGVYRAKFEVETIINKMREGWLRWFRYVRRRPQSAPVKRVESMAVDGLRRMGRPKLR
ncbi:hypothetical protein Tco_0296579 [Tanacetum coccineum]